MKAQQLKNSILQMAVQGKLVPQDPDDEPARVLLERIRAEKAKLIKEGKIKKEKAPSYIFRGEDNLPYEKIGDNEPVCIADEVPFEIPESWEWVRLKNIANVVSARRVHQSDWRSKGVPFYRAREIGKLSELDHVDNELYISEELFTELSKSGIPQKDDLMLTAVGTLGKVYIVKANDRFYYKDASVICIENFGKIVSKYLRTVLYSPFLAELIKKKSAGTTVDTITIVKANEYIIPLPPLTEQKRIVEALEALQPYIDEYEAKETTLTKLNADFPDLLKKSILQQAVMGKLVPQDENDEPASVLLERIRAEKAARIKVGKLKKDKHESVIYRRGNSHYEKLDGAERCIDEELPFDIPDSWEWCRLSHLGEIVGGGTPKTNEPDFWDGGKIPWLTPADMKYVKGIYVEKGERYITEKGLRNSSAQLMPKGSVLYSSRAPIGYIAIAANSICTNQGFKSLVPAYEDINIYLYYCLIACTPEIQSRASGTTFKEISGSEFGKTLIPLPPLAEQKRIAAKIEELLKACKMLFTLWTNP